MSGTLAKIAKKRAYPCTLPNEEVISIRPLEIGETNRMKAIPDEAKTGFALGKVLVEDNGDQSYLQGEKETDEDFGMRINLECRLDEPSLNAVMAAVQKASKQPKLDTLVKNLPETTPPDSQ